MAGSANTTHVQSLSQNKSSQGTKAASRIYSTMEWKLNSNQEQVKIYKVFTTTILC